MSITRLSGKAVVASWGQHHIEGIDGLAALCDRLLRQFEFCTTLHFDAEQPCYIRVLVRADENAQGLADEIVAVIQQHLPLELDASQIVETRVVPADEPPASEVEQLKAQLQREKERVKLMYSRWQAAAGPRVETTRYKHAATALWQALDSIAEIDSIGGDDARFRLDARQLAKLRLEHAIRRGRDLLWSWQSPLPPVGALMPEGLDVEAELAAGQRLAKAAKPVAFEPYRGPIDEHTTEDERVRWCPDAKREPDASAE